VKTIFEFEDGDSRNKAADRLAQKFGKECVEIKYGSFECLLKEGCSVEEALDICRLYGGKLKNQ